MAIFYENIVKCNEKRIPHSSVNMEKNPMDYKSGRRVKVGGWAYSDEYVYIDFCRTIKDNY